MKTINQFIISLVVLFVIYSCAQKTGTEAIQQNKNTIDTINLGCLASFDTNPLDNKEKINQVYGKNHIKDGHWISFGFAVTKSPDNKTNRVKLQEGFYRKNKKVGFWKFYNEDGTIKDSVEYKNDVLVIN